MHKNLIDTGKNGPAEKIVSLINSIKTRGPLLRSKKVSAGFDGFIDSIVKVVRKKPTKKPPVFFNTKRAFGNYIIGKSGTSFSLELEEVSIKSGGNMPIMANALGSFGISVNCIGAFGVPQIHPVFKHLSSNCFLHSFTDPGISTAIEFRDGKIILGQMSGLNNAGWQIIRDRIGVKTLVEMFKESDLLCMVNWAEIDASAEIWQGLVQEVFPLYTRPVEKQIAFFDLSDCSKRSSGAIIDALSMLREFSRYTNVMLGLNQNEARLIYQVFYKTTTAKGLHFIGEKIFEKLTIDTLILHSPKEAIAVNQGGKYSSKSFFVNNPVLSTGAGDNFNAGFCTARLLQLDLESALVFANAVSGLYIRTGISPQLPDIINFLKNDK